MMACQASCTIGPTIRKQQTTASRHSPCSDLQATVGGTFEMLNHSQVNREHRNNRTSTNSYTSMIDVLRYIHGPDGLDGRKKMATIKVNCLQRDKSGGQCERATLYVEVLPTGRIQDAESGYVYPKTLSNETILGWGELDGNSHVILEGACHEYLVPSDWLVMRLVLCAKRLRPPTKPTQGRRLVRRCSKLGVAMTRSTPLNVRTNPARAQKRPGGQSSLATFACVFDGAQNHWPKRHGKRFAPCASSPPSGRPDANRCRRPALYDTLRLPAVGIRPAADASGDVGVFLPLNHTPRGRARAKDVA
jgi:hypothetical protein